MAFQRYMYANTPSNLEGIDWVTSKVYAQLLNLTYSYNTAHATRGDVVSAAVAAPVALSGKTKTISGSNTFLSCSQLQFANNPSAKHVVFLIGDATAPSTSDKVLGVVDLNDGVAEEVVVNFGIGFNGGLFNLQRGA